MPDIIARESQQLEQDSLIQLFQLDVTRWGGGTLYFSPDFNDGQAHKMNGYEYQPFPMQVEGFEYSGQGTLPQPTLTVANIDFTWMSLILGNDDLVGAPITRIRTYRKFLDDGSDPSPEATFPEETFIISQKTQQDNENIQFSLRVSFDQQGKKLPGRQCLRTCPLRYRYYDKQQKKFIYEGVTCPYAGDKYFDATGEEVDDPSKDVCSKQLKSGCKARFGENAELPFGGFPALQRYNQG